MCIGRSKTQTDPPYLHVKNTTLTHTITLERPFHGCPNDSLSLCTAEEREREPPPNCLIKVLNEESHARTCIDMSPNCPRCGCSNTKFCYYNNYSLTQPRYFCKGCRRYWTKGGSLRNVPVGGGCRKNRRGMITNKSLRLSSSSDNNSKTAPMIRHCYGGGESITNNLFSADDHHGTRIDLALVYANFLSQKPDLCKTTNNGTMIDHNINGSEIIPDQLGFDNNNPSLEFSSSIGLMPQIVPNDHHHHQQQIFFCGLDDQDQRSRHYDDPDCPSDFGLLPPLPSQEPILMWSNPDHHSLMVGQTRQVSSRDHDDLPPMVGPDQEADHREEEEGNNNLQLDGNWSPFDDLPIDDHTFSRGNEDHN